MNLRPLLLIPLVAVLAGCGGGGSSAADSTPLPKPAYDKMAAVIATLEGDARSSVAAESSCADASLDDPVCADPLLAATNSATMLEFADAYRVSLPSSEGACRDALHALAAASQGYWHAWLAFGDAVGSGSDPGSADLDAWRETRIPAARDAFVADCRP